MGEAVQIRLAPLAVLTVSLACCQTAVAGPSSIAVEPASARIRAGDSLGLVVIVRDDQGTEYPVHPAFIRWYVDMEDSLAGAISTESGLETSFTATKAHGTTSVWVCCTEGTGIIGAKTTIEVVPARAYQIHIEADAPPRDLRAPSSSDTVHIQEPDSAVVAYGIVRDEYENYISMAEEAAWAWQREGVVSLTSPAERQGEALIVGLDTGVSAVTVRAPGLLGDTVIIVVGEHSTAAGLRTLSHNTPWTQTQARGTVYDISGRCVSTMKVGMHTGLLITSKSGETIRTVRTAGKAWSVSR